MKSLGGWNDSLIGSKASTSLNNGTVVRDLEDVNDSQGSQQGSSQGGSTNPEPGTVTPEPGTGGTDPSTGGDTGGSGNSGFGEG
jgi:hypothetical protein